MLTLCLEIFNYFHCLVREILPVENPMVKLTTKKLENDAIPGGFSVKMEYRTFVLIV
jgi:hypothetical protein